MPLYTYNCDDCGASLEILHGVGQPRETCGLDCQLQGAGSFGKGRVVQQLESAHVQIGKKGARSKPQQAFSGFDREALRQEGLRRLGGELTEANLDTLRDKGINVYRKESGNSWSKTGGDEHAPATIRRPDGED